MSLPAYLPKWVTREFFEETRRLWSSRYGWTLTDEETCEIILNVSKLLDILQGEDA